MNAAGAGDIVDVSNEDFLSVDINDLKYESVTCVMLDPSCSGSGAAIHFSQKDCYVIHISKIYLIFDVNFDISLLIHFPSFILPAYLHNLFTTYLQRCG